MPVDYTMQDFVAILLKFDSAMRGRWWPVAVHLRRPEQSNNLYAKDTVTVPYIRGICEICPYLVKPKTKISNQPQQLPGSNLHCEYNYQRSYSLPANDVNAHLYPLRILLLLGNNSTLVYARLRGFLSHRISFSDQLMY